MASNRDVRGIQGATPDLTHHRLHAPRQRSLPDRGVVAPGTDRLEHQPPARSVVPAKVNHPARRHPSVWPTVAAVLALLLWAPTPAAAITGEGCRFEQVVTLPVDGAVTITLRYNPKQRVVIGFVTPRGDRLYSEHVERTSLSGALRRTYTPRQIRLWAGGKVAVVVITSKSCRPGHGGRSPEVRVVELPGTSTEPTLPRPPALPLWGMVSALVVAGLASLLAGRRLH